MKNFSLILLLLAATVSQLHAQHDWSEEKNIVIDEPEFAIVKLTGIDRMPESKTDTLKAWLEFDDGEGNTFIKRVRINAQGNSSLMFEKKNVAVAFCEDEWIGDKTTDITFGNWVKQDEFHLKAYYTDYFRGVGTAAYKIYDDIVATLPDDINRPWKRAGLEGEDNQLCHPEGFPCAVYLNDDFYGVFSWNLKKHRKNMNMKKNNPNHVHLDGSISIFTVFSSYQMWKQFEVRNPKPLYCMTGSLYNGENPRELIDERSPYFNLKTDSADVKEAKAMSLTVKNNIIELGRTYSNIVQMENAQKDAESIRQFFAGHFDLQSMIDYYIFTLVTNNSDGLIKNWQWFTYDGVKWFVEPYDLDLTFGNTFTGELRMTPEWGFVDDDYTMNNEYISWGPLQFVVRYFQEELQQRYSELRQSQVITLESMYSHVENWTKRIPNSYMQMEKEKWSKSPCFLTTIPNEGWKQIHDYTGWINLPEYNDATAYTKGTRVKINSSRDFSTWEAERDIQGVFPYQQIGTETSFEELYEWIERKLQLIDDLLNYTESNTVNVPMIYMHRSSGTWNVLGQRIAPGYRGLVIENGKKIIK